MLLPTDLEIDLGGPSLAGTDGVVLWGAPDAFKTSATYVSNAASHVHLTPLDRLPAPDLSRTFSHTFS